MVSVQVCLNVRHSIEFCCIVLCWQGYAYVTVVDVSSILECEANIQCFLQIELMLSLGSTCH